MRYAIVVVGFAAFLIWDGVYNDSHYIDAGVRSLRHVVGYVAR
jgi:hypothetical protein